MGGDDDLARALPRPPFPAPARREAAIAEAMRRFDGESEERPAPAQAARPAPSRSWWASPGGAFASAALVALIALPVAWVSLGNRPRQGSFEPPPRVAAPAARPGAAPAAPTAPASG